MPHLAATTPPRSATVPHRAATTRYRAATVRERLSCSTQTTRTNISTILISLLLLNPAFAKPPKRFVVRGDVEFSDGSAPQQLVAIEKVCKGVVQAVGFADSGGGFKIDLGPLDNVPAGDLAGCEAQAYLPGYRSQKLPLRGASADNLDLGTLTLKPLGKQGPVARSSRDKEPLKSAKKLYANALDTAARGNWKTAEDLLERATALFHWYTSAWLNLGVLQERKGDLGAAKKSYKEAIQCDDGFALPHLQAAGVEVARQDWQEALTESAKVIELDPQAFPRAYLLNAQANLNLHHVDEAEKRAREGLKLDDQHRFPELEYVLALVLTDKGDRAGAIEHLEAYLALAPRGPSADAARDQLSHLKEVK
jgi:tetratricopeptide (TPR) repeat protein